ncbi:MAG: hypothetical protein VR68_12000 [Peptococcaceae bacterium BRH_c4a]|nr:MAG: hypothetical protein VR68_12000 [Peptococcaceae bacterium BRH_c4a]
MFFKGKSLFKVIYFFCTALLILLISGTVPSSIAEAEIPAALSEQTSPIGRQSQIFRGTVQVATLQDSVFNYPTIVNHFPGKNAEGVPPEIQITATLDREVDPVDLSKIIIKDHKGKAVIGVNSTLTGRKLTVSHSGLAYETDYTVTIPGNTVRSKSGAVYNRETSWRFSTAKEIVFNDLPKTHWVHDVIYKLCRLGMINEYPDNTFNPDENITRAEFIRILIVALGITEIISDPPAFEDVQRSAWYYGFVQAAAKAGLVFGYGGRLDPDVPITRQEMAGILVKALKGKNTAGATENLNFTDAEQIAPWFRDQVRIVVLEGMMQGYPDQTFRSQSTLTRAEAYAAILCLLEKLNQVITCSVQTPLIHITGQNMEKQGSYWLQVYDGDNNHVGTIGINADSNGGFVTSYSIKGTEASGNWRIDVLKGQNLQHTEVSCTFFVPLSAIPEFPAAIAGIIVVGICVFIYHRMKQGKESLVV